MLSILAQQQIPAWMNDPAQSEADQLAFHEYVRERTILNFMLLGYGIVAAGVLWWPLDLVVYAGRPDVIEGFAWYRAELVVLNLFLLNTVPRFERAPAYAQELAISGFIVNVLLAVWHLAEIGRGDPLFLSLAYLLPLFGMALLLPLRARISRMLWVAIATLGGWGLHPLSSYGTPGATATASFFVFCCVVSVGVGHGMYILIRRSFHLHLQVDRQRDALTDLTVHLEHRVADQTRDLKSMHLRAQTVRAEQRGELARDLHDGLGQELTSMRLLVAFGKHGGEVGELLDELDTQVDRVQLALRRVLEALRPERLDELGLVEATRVLALELERRSGLTITVSVSDDFPVPLPTPVSVALYRVTQEALNNALRHARATRIELSLSGTVREVRMAIADDGIGTPKNALGSGIGTQGILDRVHALDGTVRWSGPPGTTLHVHLPLRNAS